MSDENSGFELTRRRLLGGVALTGVAATGAGAGTMAALSDTESSSGNTIKAGTLDLTRSNSGDFRFGISNVSPGDSVGRIAVTLDNVGTIPADHVEIDIDTSSTEDANGDLSSSDSGPESDDSPNSAAGMAKYIVVDNLEYAGPSDDNSTPQYVDNGQPTSAGENRGIVDQNGSPTSWVDLDDLDTISDLDNDTKDRLDDFEAPEMSGENKDGDDYTGESADFNLDLRVHPDMPDDYQGDVLETTITVSLHQNGSQDTDIDS